MCVESSISSIHYSSLQWRHNGRYGVLYHQPHDCLLNRLFRCRSTKNSKLCVTGFCVGNSLVTGEFSAQVASNADKAFIWWRHHVLSLIKKKTVAAPIDFRVSRSHGGSTYHLHWRSTSRVSSWQSTYRQFSIRRRNLIPKYRCFLSRIAVVFA